MERLRRVFEDESGQGLVEYALILAFLVVVVVGAVRVLGEKTVGLYTDSELTEALAK